MSSSRLDDFLEDSPIARAMAADARGESVDWDALARRQLLETIRVGQIFALETLQAERQADEDAITFLEMLSGIE